MVRLSNKRKHHPPDAEASGEIALVARDNETGMPGLAFLLRAKRHEITVALQHEFDLVGVGHAVDLALARFRNLKHLGQTFGQCRGGDHGATHLEGFGNKNRRRVRLTVVSSNSLAAESPEAEVR